MRITKLCVFVLTLCDFSKFLTPQSVLASFSWEKTFRAKGSSLRVFTSTVGIFKKQFLNDLKYFALFEPQAGCRTMPLPVCFRSVWGMVSFQFMVCYALEAYRQLVTQRASWGMKLRIWAMSEWNIIELVYLRLSIIRIIKKYSHQFLHCINLLMLKLRVIFEIRLL